jgi:hypothetical protein
MGLIAEIDFRAQQHYFALAYGRLGDGRAAIEILLAPGPAAIQHLLA